MNLKIPFSLAILSIIGGVSIAILFGINEELFKNRISEGLQKNIKIQQMEEPARTEKLSSEEGKLWRYYQRFHFHATGIAAMMLGLLLFVSRLNAPRRSINVAAYLVSIGGFLYPFVWLFAAIYGPEMGRSEAKEAFAIFGYMGGLFLVGAIWTLVLGLCYDTRRST